MRVEEECALRGLRPKSVFWHGSGQDSDACAREAKGWDPPLMFWPLTSMCVVTLVVVVMVHLIKVYGVAGGLCSVKLSRKKSFQLLKGLLSAHSVIGFVLSALLLAYYVSVGEQILQDFPVTFFFWATYVSYNQSAFYGHYKFTKYVLKVLEISSAPLDNKNKRHTIVKNGLTKHRQRLKQSPYIQAFICHCGTTVGLLVGYFWLHNGAQNTRGPVVLLLFLAHAPHAIGDNIFHFLAVQKTLIHLESMEDLSLGSPAVKSKVALAKKVVKLQLYVFRVSNVLLNVLIVLLCVTKPLYSYHFWDVLFAVFLLADLTLVAPLAGFFIKRTGKIKPAVREDAAKSSGTVLS